MGTVVHHVVIVTTFFSVTDQSAKEAVDIAKSLGLTVTEPVMSPINGYTTFMVVPSGSKQNWPDVDDHDQKVQKFIDYLKSAEYDDGSSPYEWVELSYGSDLDAAYILNTPWK